MNHRLLTGGHTPVPDSFGRGTTLKRLGILFMFGLLLVIGRLGAAATFTWDGGDTTNSNFAQANNWNPNGAPATNGSADLIFTGSVRLNPNAEAAYQLNSIAFASFASANAFTIGGSQLTIGAGGITNSDADAETINNAIVLAAAQIWSGQTGGLTFGGAVNTGGFLLTFSTNFVSAINGVISGSGGLTKDNGGTLTLGGSSANTFSGTTTVNGGTLALNKTSGNAVSSASLIIGDGSGPSNADVVQLSAANQIADTTAVTVNSSGKFDLNGKAETIASLTVTGGNLTIGAGTLTNAGSLSMTGGNVSSTGVGKLVLGGDLTTIASASSATISNNLDLGGATRTFTVNDGTATTDLDISAVISNGGLTKAGTGVLILNGSSANTYGGDTTVNAGTLLLIKSSGNAISGANLVIGDGSGGTGADVVQSSTTNQIADTTAVTVNSSGQFSATATDTVGSLTVNGGSVVIPDTGALTASSLQMTAGKITNLGNGKLVLGGDVTTNASANTASITTNGTSGLDLGGATRTFTVADGSATTDLDVSAVISNGGLTKAGTGRMQLSGTAANTYTGDTTVNAGTLVLNKTAGITAIGGTNLIVGDGIGAGDAVQLNASNQIADTTAVSVGSSGSFGTSKFTETIGSLSLNGLLGIGEIGANGALIVTGNTQVNTNGFINLLAGTFTANSLLSVNGGTIAATGDSVVANAGLAMTAGSISANLSLTGDVTTQASASSASLGGTLSLSSGNHNFTVADGAAATDLDVSAIISNGGLTKAGLGRLRLSGTNTFAGGVTLNDGTLTIANDSAAGTGTLTLNVGTIETDGNNRNLSNPVVVNGDLNIGNQANTLTLSGNMGLGGTNGTFVGSRLINVGNSATFAGVISNGSAGADGLIKSGAGTLTLAGSAANTYTGSTTLFQGTLRLNKSVANGAIGAGGIGTNSGTTLRLLASDQIADTANVAVAGSFDLNGFNETIQSITLGGGSVTTGAGILTLGGDVIANTSPTTATISGNLTLGATRTFTVNDGTATTDLDVSAAITDNKNLIKNGAGTMALSGATPVGTTGSTATISVNAGTLLLNKTSSQLFGNLVVGDGVNSATVRYTNQNGVIVGEVGTFVQVNNAGLFDLNNRSDFIRDLIINGGAVTTESGLVGLAGNLSSLANATTGTISGKIDLNAHHATFDVADGSAAIDLDIPAVITNGFIVKNGAGTLRLSGANTFSPTFTLNSGTLLLANDGALGGSGGGINFGGGLVKADGASRTFTGGLSVTGDATVDGSFNLTFDSLSISGQGKLTKNGTGSLALTNNLNPNSLQGDLNLNGGTLTASTPLNTTGTFTQNAGTINGTVANAGTFIYNGGTFNGQLQNNGTATFNANFIAGNGITNSTAITINPGGVIEADGSGVTNDGVITLNGGVLLGSGPIVNNGSIVGNGSLGGSSFSNTGVLTLSGGKLVFGPPGANTNSGTINGAAGLTLDIESNLTNTGTINLNGGFLSGPGSLTNALGGTAGGFGTISISTLTNSGGTLLAQGGTLRLNNALSNPGTIQIASGATLAGAAVANTGTVQGAGTISSALTNSGGGTVEPVGGTLTLTGPLSNNAGATINAAIGNKLTVASGLATNAGAIDLSGGTFDNNNHALDNTGSITGYGTFRTGGAGLTNDGSILFAGGSASISGDVTNASGHIIEVRNTPAIFLNNVTNNGTFKTTNTTATFAGTFTNNGTFDSDPATQFFQNLTVGTSGALHGGAGDIFNINGDLISNSGQSAAFDVSGARISLSNGTHNMIWSARDLGGSGAGFDNNFAIGIFELGPGAVLQMLSGALYVHEFLLDGGVAEVASISDSGNIYYDAADPANSYLNGQTYALEGGGMLVPISVPEPGVTTLLCLALAGLCLRSRAGR